MIFTGLMFLPIMIISGLRPNWLLQAERRNSGSTNHQALTEPPYEMVPMFCIAQIMCTWMINSIFSRCRLPSIFAANISLANSLFSPSSPWIIISWIAVISLVIILVGFLAGKVIPGESASFILELPPLRWPQMKNILIKTLSRIEWYLQEAVPLFILGTLILFILDKSGALTSLEKLARPLVVYWLGLPAESTSSFIIGFLRRDYGAAGFFAMAQKGLLTPNQVLVALVTITLFVPCIANFFVIIKERGWKTALVISGLVIFIALLMGGIVDWALKTLAITL